MKTVSMWSIGLVAVIALGTVSGHVSSCPGHDPLVYWKLAGVGTTAQRTVTVREYTTISSRISCNSAARGFNGRSYTVLATIPSDASSSSPTSSSDDNSSSSGSGSDSNWRPTNGSAVPVADRVPIETTVYGLLGDQNGSVLCLDWATPPGYNVYTVIVHAGSFARTYTYGPTALVAAGTGLCTIAVPNVTTEAAYVTYCYAETVDVDFDDPAGVLHEAWFDVVWSLSLSPAISRLALCTGSAPTVRALRLSTATVAPGTVATRRVVSGAFRVSNRAAAVTAWLASEAWGGATELTPLDVTCDDLFNASGLLCGFVGVVDPRSTPVHVAGFARVAGSGLVPGVGCAPVRSATVREMRGVEYTLAFRGVVVSSGALDMVPGAVDDVAPAVLLESLPGDHGFDAVLSFPNSSMPSLTATVTLSIQTMECQ
jgi:hypothetical protein